MISYVYDVRQVAPRLVPLALDACIAYENGDGLYALDLSGTVANLTGIDLVNYI